MSVLLELSCGQSSMDLRKLNVQILMMCGISDRFLGNAQKSDMRDFGVTVDSFVLFSSSTETFFFFAYDSSDLIISIQISSIYFITPPPQPDFPVSACLQAALHRYNLKSQSTGSYSFPVHPILCKDAFLLRCQKFLHLGK